LSTKKELDWSSRRLQSEVRDSITKFFETVLDFSEVAVGDEKRYKALRSKVLRHGNETIRKITANIESNYDILFTKIGEDVVQVSNVKRGEDNNE